MIERFNFFDLYGYLFPGAVLLLLIAAPFLLLSQAAPPEWLLGAAGILGGLLASYVVGLLLSSAAEQALPSKIHEGEADARGEHPSNLMLAPKNDWFSVQFKQRLVALIKETFHLDVVEGADAERARPVAFFLCRARLIQADKAKYVEQFQGMYSLARSLSMSFFLTAFFYFGWSLALTRRQGIHGVSPGEWSLVGLAVLSTAAASLYQYRLILVGRGLVKKKDGQWAQLRGCGRCFLRTAVRRIWILLGIGTTLGGIVASRSISGYGFGTSLGMWLAALVTFAVGLRLRSMHLLFMRKFAETVYQDFVSLAESGASLALEPKSPEGAG